MRYRRRRGWCWNTIDELLAQHPVSVCRTVMEKQYGREVPKEWEDGVRAYCDEEIEIRRIEIELEGVVLKDGDEVVINSHHYTLKHKCTV